jgi:cytoskeletal protein CcmA (bactofilin family)
VFTGRQHPLSPHAPDANPVTIFRGAIRSLLVSLLVVTVVLAGVPGLAAAETRTGGSIVVGAGEVVEEDPQVFAGSVVVRGTVSGDVEAFAGTVRIEGTVDGDVNAVGGSVDIAEGATVTGDLNAAGEDVILGGSVGGDANVGAEVVRLLGIVPVAGTVADLAVFLLGLGALALVAYRAYRGRSNRRADEPPAVDDTGDDTGRPAA